MKNTIYISFISILLLNSLSAQVSSKLELSSTFDDNVFRSPIPVEDVITDFDFDFGYRFLNSNFQIYYNGNLILFQNQKERNLSLHRLGLSYFLPFGRDEQHTFFIGVNGLTRLDGEEYKEYDYNQFYAYANLRFDFDFLFLKTGYNFRYRDYSNFAELNNLRHYIFLQMNKSFESRTTLILEADLGYKAFTSPIYFTTLQNSTFGGGGNGQGPGGGTSIESSVPVTVAADIPPMGHIVFLARIAQSIFEKMGVYIQYRKQVNLSNQITSITGSNFYQDEELFDDPFSFDSQSLSGQLTWMMPWSMRLQFGGFLNDKNYIEESAYISIDDSIGAGGNRLDNQKNFYLNLTKTFDIEEKWLNALFINFYIGYTQNKSNSYWYNYDNRIIGGGVQWHF
jgi:hypothetical protein